MILYCMALLVLAGLPLSWLLHGFDGVTRAWNVPVTSAFLVALAQWPGHFRRKADRRLREWDAALDAIAYRPATDDDVTA